MLKVALDPAILMERACDKTLAQWILGGDPLSLDFMRRFGEHLLSAIEHLEQEGIAAREAGQYWNRKVAGTGAYRLLRFLALTRTGRDDQCRDPAIY